MAGGAGHTLALTSDGEVTAWGFNDSGQATVPCVSRTLRTQRAGRAGWWSPTAGSRRRLGFVRGRTRRLGFARCAVPWARRG
ncbi:RCC1-like domain-containing protein [Nocardioides panacis]|uniref:RCC1-like domain-containing protein n=1 Tax=Nocardioides panacis TaxID=2849501 RepID=UPI0020B1BD6A|nr:RCC1 domain-containing protein [Nocardioides panacis]